MTIIRGSTRGRGGGGRGGSEAGENEFHPTAQPTSYDDFNVTPPGFQQNNMGFEEANEASDSRAPPYISRGGPKRGRGRGGFDFGGED